MSSDVTSIIHQMNTLSDKLLQSFLDSAVVDTLHRIKRHADDLYYNAGESSGLTDWQYDMLKDTLVRRDPHWKVPIGTAVRGDMAATELPYHMGSMDKIKSGENDRLARWLVQNSSFLYSIEDKLDGVSCLAVYGLDDQNVRLYKRGDDRVGMEITHLAPYFATLPRYRPSKHSSPNELPLNELSQLYERMPAGLAVRGELIMRKDVFHRKYAAQYENPRNFVAGRLGGKIARDGLQDIDFVAYEIVSPASILRGSPWTDGVVSAAPHQHSYPPAEQIKILRTLGFLVPQHELVSSTDVTMDTLADLFIDHRAKSPYEIDGVIVQPNEGYTRNLEGNPDYAIAYKMKTDGVPVEVTGVAWNVSKWGQIKPRVQIKPTRLQGVTITYATGHNAKFIYDHNIGPGAVVMITRSGDVIPYIVSVVTPALQPDMPKHTPYRWNDTHVDIVTTETNNITTRIKLIHGFLQAIGAKFVGEKYIEKLYAGGLTTLLGILQASQADLASIPGVGPKMAERMYTSMQNSLRGMQLHEVLGASGLFGFGIGSRKIEALLEAMPTILTDAVTGSLPRDELLHRVAQVSGFSDKTAPKIVDNLASAHAFVVSLTQLGGTFTQPITQQPITQQSITQQSITQQPITQQPIHASSNRLPLQSETSRRDRCTPATTLEGTRIVFSGKRDKSLETAIVSRGAKIDPRITRNATMLIIDSEGDKAHSKYQEAQRLGIPVLLKHEFVSNYML